MSKKYKKKPLVVEAMQFNNLKDHKAIDQWMQESGVTPAKTKNPIPKNPILLIPTLEGIMSAKPGDYIIKGINGEFYPCKPDIFKQTYEETT